MAGLTLRDLVSRRVPRRIGTLQLSAWAYVALMPAGLALMLAAGEAPVGPDARGWALLVATVCVGAVGYAAITGAVLLGEVAVVAPLRYVRLVLAMLIGVVFFAERPDAWTLAGAAVILASGLYTLGREARLGATGAASITRTGTRS